MQFKSSIRFDNSLVTRHNPEYLNRAKPYPGACGHQAAGNFAHDNARITDQTKVLIIFNLSGDTWDPRNVGQGVFLEYYFIRGKYDE